eukprot:TRINITY_DN40494_c0_g1_i1.p1 TRINITY_DN40494_c0_g1~~TRINITY_DN40494_c0_g1_i1.p1  ORF type:complete len:335 (-),score=51.38 TRINITY_DN40494_c0_g1_i1:332-1336(-)
MGNSGSKTPAGVIFETHTPAVVSGDASKRRILFLRHGQGTHQLEHNVTDPLLTDLGRRQAAGWAMQIGNFNADLILVSPLRRAVETACLAFKHEQAPFRLQRQARECWWSHTENQFGNRKDLLRLLEEYGRQGSTQGVDEALNGSHDAASEKESVEDMYNILAQSQATTIVVVCHWGVINALCNHSADNCELVLCKFGKPGRLQVIRGFKPPQALQYAYVEASQDSAENGKHYRAGDKGFCTQEELGAERVTVRFDNGQTHKPPRTKLRTLFALGDRVTTLRDSSSNGRWYKKGEFGHFLGYSRDAWRAIVQFDDGKVEKPSKPGDTLEKVISG